MALVILLIGNEVAEGGTRRFDMQLLRSAQALRAAHPGAADVMRDFIGAAVVMTTLVGVSRGVLGLQWATDILGGWAFGTAWSAMWLLVVRWWSRGELGAAGHVTCGP